MKGDILLLILFILFCTCVYGIVFLLLAPPNIAAGMRHTLAMIAGIQKR